jgi:CcmD family protein
MGNLGYLFAGFAVVWCAAFGYLWHLGRRARRLERRLVQVEERLSRS